MYLPIVWVTIQGTKELFSLEKRVNTHVEGIHFAISSNVQGFVRIMECCTILCLWSDRVNCRGQCIGNTYYDPGQAAVKVKCLLPHLCFEAAGYCIKQHEQTSTMLLLYRFRRVGTVIALRPGIGPVGTRQVSCDSRKSYFARNWWLFLLICSLAGDST